MPLGRLVALCILLLSLVSCAGVGIVATSDPDVKLQDATVLFDRYNRPRPAEMLIREAIAIYEERGDRKGLGRAYETYGLLLVSASVQRWEHVYRRDGFRDKSLKFDDRYAKAVEYFERAEPLLREAEQFDLLTGLYYNKAYALNGATRHAEACDSFARSLEAYQENMRRNPAAKPNTAGFASVPDAIEDGKRRLGCS